jgi:hypothetical protein
VGEECEAFVSGRYFEIIDRHEMVPDWIWLNAVAHAERADLERLADRSDRSDRLVAGLSYLAVEVLAVCDHQHLSLRRAQREALMPFELELISTTTGRRNLAALIPAIRTRLETVARTTRPGSLR